MDLLFLHENWMTNHERNSNIHAMVNHHGVVHYQDGSNF